MSKLFEPTSINGMVIANRFVRSATYEGMANDDGSCTQKLIDYMARLAIGGVGLIITGDAYVRPDGQALPRQMGAYSEDLLPGLLKMTRAVHGEGGKIALQICHAGCLASPQFAGIIPMGPTMCRIGDSKPCQEMTAEDIDEVIASFAHAADRAKRAKFDAVQIHAAHGFLLSEFLSPFFNKRRDGYGGSIENRARIVLEILRSIRKAVGKQYPVLVKINSEDFLDGGFTINDMLNVSSMLEHAGIDAIEISGGISLPIGKFTPSRQGKIKPEIEGYYLDAARHFKEKIGVPLILVGGIRSYETAQRFIEEGVADYISLCRPLICEPDLINRWKSGDTHPARCISDNLCLKSLLERMEMCCEIEEKRKGESNLAK